MSFDISLRNQIPKREEGNTSKIVKKDTKNTSSERSDPENKDMIGIVVIIMFLGPILLLILGVMMRK